MIDKYKPNVFKKEIYNIWEKIKIFSNKKSKNNNNFDIILPPPNITGVLHLGHAYQQVITDFLIRYNKMLNKKVFLTFGFDHAGIATQIIIEKKININILKNKKKIIKKTLLWKNYIEKKIVKQMKNLGILIDYKNVKFTLDKKFKKIVKNHFIKLFRKKIIYKKNKIVNWDIKLKTTVSDSEITYIKKIKKLWYINLNIFNSIKTITIATIRPELIISSTAIAINPKDLRYIKLKNKYVILPIINRIIPIIFDSKININFGTGCMQVTPGHSFIDYEIAKNNNISYINIINKNGTIKNNIKEYYFDNKKINYFYLSNNYKNLKIKEFKKKILKNLNILKIIKKFENHQTLVPYNNRNNNIIESIITKQWFIKIKKMFNNINNIINNINFFPNKYKKHIKKYLENIDDWCISRQIWWGHKIPIWYDKENNIYCGISKKNIISYYNLDKNIKIYQEKSVLDTWFSSALWYLSNINFKKNKLFLNNKTYDFIISGYDIINFWILKMIIFSNYFTKINVFKIPFKNVYITGLINDKNGKKMSKFCNNVINPNDIIYGNNKIPECGTDALRMFFISLLYKKNINYDIYKILSYKNFCNKLWNSNFFIIKNSYYLNKMIINYKNIKFKLDINKWILYKFNLLIKNFNDNIINYKFYKIIKEVYIFFWKDFCDFYIEISKYYIFNDINKKEICYILIYLYEKILRILHPIIPFITEKIWQNIFNNFKKLNINYNNKSIILQKFPKYYKKFKNKKYLNFEIILNIIKEIRKIDNKNSFILLISKNKKKINLIKNNKNIIIFITKINDIYFKKNKKYKKKIIKNIDDIIIYRIINL